MLMSRHQKSLPKTQKSVGQIALQFVASHGYTDEGISVLNQCGDKITLISYYHFPLVLVTSVYIITLIPHSRFICVDISSTRFLQFVDHTDIVQSKDEKWAFTRCGCSSIIHSAIHTIN